MTRLKLTNDTHWRSTDIKRIVRGACDAAGLQGQVDAQVRYGRNNPNPWVKLTEVVGSTEGIVPRPLLTIELGRRGSKSPHPVAMVALAANFAVKDEVPEDSKLLAFVDTYYLANFTAYLLAKHRFQTEPDMDEETRAVLQKLRSNAGEVLCPDWITEEKCFIAKYRDPKKDASYLDFVKKKEKQIEKLTTEIDDLDVQITRLMKLKTTREKKRKAAEKSLKDAKARRS